MARVNRWKQFGDAFDAVYNAGNTLGKAIQTGGIAFKSYEDEEGKKLTGLALDRARMDDYAAAEQRFGDPMEALRMRTGVETLGQNKLQTDYLTDTYDERVLQGGLLASNKLRADTSYTNSAAGLNFANADRINLGTKIRGASKDDEIKSNTARFQRDTAQADGQTTAYKDPSYSGGLIAAQEAAQAQNKANTTRYNSTAYADSLKATDQQTTAEATLARNTAELQNTVITDEIYKENFIAAEKAKMGQTATIAQIDEALANDPRTREIADANLDSTLNNALAAVQQSIADLELKSTQGFQDSYVSAGLSQAELGAVQGEEAVLLARQSLAVNTFIKEWGKTGNPDDPTSMRNLIKGISQINPIMGQKLSQDYGEHELWEITNRSLRMRAETNEALTNRGVAGAQEILDKYNGDALGIKVVKNDDGSMSMVETRAVGPGGQETEVVRTIASGADEKAFMQDLNAALDPASLMEYSMNLVDMDYKRALTKYNEAQAKAAGLGKPLSATDQAYRTMVDKNASPADRRLATAFLMRENPELYTQLMEDMNFQSVLDSASDSDVPDKLVAPVDLDAPKTETEQATAEDVLAVLTSPESTADQRTEALKGDNRKLVEKYFGKEVLEMEDNKTIAAATMLRLLDNGGLKLTPEGLEQFNQGFVEQANKRAPMDKSGLTQKTAQRVVSALQEDPMGILNILIGNLRGEVKPAPVKENGPQRNSRENKNAAIEEQIAQLRQLIEAMQGR